MSLVQVEFLRTNLPYFVGDKAGFQPEHAQRLVGLGAARLVEQEVVVEACSMPARVAPVKVVTPAKPAADAAALAGLLGLDGKN